MQYDDFSSIDQLKELGEKSPKEFLDAFNYLKDKYQGILPMASALNCKRQALHDLKYRFIKKAEIKGEPITDNKRPYHRKEKTITLPPPANEKTERRSTPPIENVVKPPEKLPSFAIILNQETNVEEFEARMSGITKTLMPGKKYRAVVEIKEL